MAEEHRCETPEGHRLCVNNCGFFGSSTTMNLCSNCYGDLCLKQQQQASMKSTVESSLSASPPVIEPVSSSSSSSTAVLENYAAKLEIPKKTEEEKKPIQTPTEQHQQPQRPTRCTVCRKRVGLTGFMCRCGTTFCGTHRYPEVHGCTFDFKSAGREEIAKANPLVIAAKLQKI